MKGCCVVGIILEPGFNLGLDPCGAKTLMQVPLTFV